MYPHSFLWHYLWLPPYALQAAVAVIMIRRRLARDYPAFFVYTVFEPVQGIVLFGLDHTVRANVKGVTANHYWICFWVFLVASIALRFAIIYEIFSHVLLNYRGLWELSRVLFGCTAVVLLVIAIAISAYGPANDPHPILGAVHVVNRAVSVMQTGQLLFLFLFSSYFRLSWRSYTYGIALGLGIFSSVDLATSAIRASLGPAPGNYVFDFITMTTYHCCVLLWLVYVLAPESSRQMVNTLPGDNLEHWKVELERLLLR
jgi:hypothetical protein